MGQQPVRRCEGVICLGHEANKVRRILHDRRFWLLRRLDVVRGRLPTKAVFGMRGDVGSAETLSVEPGAPERPTGLSR